MAKVIILPTAAKNIVSEIIKVSELQEGDFLWIVAEGKEESEIEKIRDAMTPLLRPGTNAVVSSFKPEIESMTREDMLELQVSLKEILGN